VISARAGRLAARQRLAHWRTAVWLIRLLRPDRGAQPGRAARFAARYAGVGRDPTPNGGAGTPLDHHSEPNRDAGVQTYI
jgi:hypothetical protein